MPFPSTRFTRSLVLGLASSFTLFPLNPVSAASIPPRDDSSSLHPVIAIKLNTSSPLTARLTPAELVDDLVRRAHSAPKHRKRNLELRISPLITTLSSDEISELVQRAVENDPTYVPTDFGSWFQVRFAKSELATDNARAELLNKLGRYSEIASVQSLNSAATKLPAVRPNDDPLFKDQGYLAGGGVGIDAKYAWGFKGGDGAGATIIDVERGWKLEHEDLKAATITLLAGKNVQDRYFGNYPHGTAVLGEILMVDNAIGGVGIAPSAKGHVVGITRDVDGNPVENRAEAILDAARFLKAGDIMLLEMQVPDDASGVWPPEIYDAEFEAIRLATAKGIIVIEPAANGDVNQTGQDMDKPILRTGDTRARALLNRKSPDYRESGAIIVGAATSGLPHKRTSFSNYGGRVDVYAWGEHIWTSTTTADFNLDDTYDQFSGTSGAAPIIAGAALSIQGMVQANRGKKLSPAELKSVLVKGGTSSANPAADRIGVMPNLKAIIDGGYLK